MLPSQTARASSSRSHMYRRHRSRRIPAIIAAVVLFAGVFIVIKVWQGRGGPDTALGAPDENTTSKSTDTGEPSRPVSPQPTRLTQPTNTAASSTQLAANQPARTNTTPANTGGTTDKISMAPSAPTAPPATNNSSQGATNPPPIQPKPSATNVGTPIPASATGNLEIKANTSTPTNAPSTTSGSAQPNAASANTPNISSTSSGTVAQRVQSGFDLLTQNKPVEGRKMLTTALESPGISHADADRIRAELTKLNQRMIFGPEIIAGDPHVMAYSIESGDSLAKLPRKLGLKTDWRFIQRINNIADPTKIRAGQRLKVVKGPFHAIVDKKNFRMDLFMGEGAERVYVRSVQVGLGEYGATPEGAFVVKSNSKLVDPAWTNPRTGEYFASGDPKNPLGKYWIGLVGTSDNIRDLETYGIHGTVDPDSIGQLRSMGCVRMLADDIALTYEVLIENVSRVEIHGEDYP